MVHAAVNIEPLSDAESAVLRTVGESDGGIATHWMNKAAGGLGDTAKTRRVLLALQKRGLVEGERARGGNVFWWKITARGLENINSSPPSNGDAVGRHLKVIP